MLREKIAKNIGYPLHDFVKCTEIIKTLSFLRESQYWDETKINEYRLKKLKVLIDYAGNNVPYYEDQFKTLKLTSKDINSLSDLNKVPILTKEIFRKENMKLVSRNFSKRNVKIGKTGGTTGAPVIVYKDIYNRSFTWASYYRWYEWMGLNYYSSKATFWGAPSVLSKSIRKKIISNMIQFIQNELVLNSFTLNDGRMLSIYQSIVEKRPLLLKGYLSALLDFATFLDKTNLQLFGIKAISSTTETLMPHHRVFLEQVFGVPVFDQYGCGEISAISYECSKHNGLHINQEHVVCEILNEDGTSVINTSGRVVATDLDNLVMPFIRYENGDVATLTDYKCSCGTNQPLMKSIEGRSIDTIMLKNGAKVHGVFFSDILHELKIMANQIQRFQVYQELPGKAEFRIECENPLKDDIKKKLYQSLAPFFDFIEIVEMERLSTGSNGKFKYIISKL